MILRLPLDAAAPSYRMGITLDEIPYLFDMRWNARDAAWYLDLYDVSEVPIILGIKVVLGTGLGMRCIDPRFPKGLFLVTDLAGSRREATIDDLGTRVVIDYFTPDEFA